MNERIGKLAEQAGLLGPSSRIGNAHEATEKFAELIIRECAGICDERARSAPIGSDEQCEAEDCSYSIKKYFGVE